MSDIYKVEIEGSGDTATAKLSKVNFVEGLTGSLVSMFDQKKAVAGGFCNLAATGLLTYTGMVAVNRSLSGQFHFNPFSLV